jgi:hypothetical protein
LANEYLLNLNMAAAAKYFNVSSTVIGQRLRKTNGASQDQKQLQLCEPEAAYG